MTSKDKKLYRLIIMAYYNGDGTESQRQAVERSFEYFHSPTINYIIEAKFKDDKTIKHIIEHMPEKMSKGSIENRINMFLEELRYNLE